MYVISVASTRLTPLFTFIQAKGHVALTAGNIILISPDSPDYHTHSHQHGVSIQWRIRKGVRMIIMLLSVGGRGGGA